MKAIIATAVLASITAISKANLQNGIYWVKSGPVCGGIKMNQYGCSGQQDCTFTAVGICPKDSQASDTYIASHFRNIGFVKKSTYFSDKDCAKDAVESSNCINVAPNASAYYRDFDNNATATNGATYAYTMSGSYFGDDNAGGYVGVANYLVTGGKSFESNENLFYVASSSDASLFNPVDRTSQDGSDIGAPIGPVVACISDIQDGACGPKIKFQPQQYKFSIFGKADGTRWDETFTEFRKIADHMLVRMEMTLSGSMTTSNVSFNDGQTLQDVGSSGVDLTSLTLKYKVKDMTDTMTFAFKDKYNIGNLKNFEPTSFPASLPLDNSTTKSITVRAMPISGSDNSFYLDYLMEIDDFADVSSYFVYDPTVTVTEENTSPTTAKAGVSTTAAISNAKMISAGSFYIIVMMAAFLF